MNDDNDYDSVINDIQQGMNDGNGNRGVGHKFGLPKFSFSFLKNSNKTFIMFTIFLLILAIISFSIYIIRPPYLIKISNLNGNRVIDYKKLVISSLILTALCFSVYYLSKM